MTRLEELTFGLVDGGLSGEESDELERLVSADAPSAGVHIRCLQVEAALRGARREIDLTAVTMERLRSLLDDKITQAVMDQIHSRSASRRQVRWRTPAWLAGAAALAVTATAIFVWLQAPRREMPAGDFIAHSAPGLVVKRQGKDMAARDGFVLKDGDTILVPQAASAVVLYSDRARVELKPSTRLRWELRSGAEPKGVFIEEGSVIVGIPPGEGTPAFRIATPQAEVAIQTAQVSITAHEDSTRLEVRHGHAVIRRVDGQAAQVPPGFFVVASPTAPFVPESIHHPGVFPHPEDARPSANHPPPTEGGGHHHDPKESK